jgi:radical SAM protein with 4Fe4S-binding SPASM domain
MTILPHRNFGRFMRKAARQPFYASRIFLKRSAALVRHGFGLTSADVPEAVTIFLTHRCNLRCAMCGQWGEGGVTKHQPQEFIRQELDTHTLEKLVTDLAPGRPSVTLFGGEPLLHPGCVNLIRAVKRRGMHCLMITNGTLLREHARGLVESGLDELNVSIDAGQELHDRIRGVPGAFERIKRGLADVQAAKKELHSGNPLINIQCTINKQNYEHLEQLIQVCRDIGADSLTFHNLIFLDRRQIGEQKKIDALLGCVSGDWEGFVFDPGIDISILQKKIAEIRTGAYPFSVDVYPNFREQEQRRYYEEADFSPADYPARCLSPWLVAYIFPDGSVRPCLNSGYTFGNIKETPFGSIWNSAQARRYRALLRTHGIFPACVRCTELYRY